MVAFLGFVPQIASGLLGKTTSSSVGSVADMVERINETCNNEPLRSGNLQIGGSSSVILEGEYVTLEDDNLENGQIEFLTECPYDGQEKVISTGGGYEILDKSGSYEVELR